jgi:hypothetical protein
VNIVSTSDVTYTKREIENDEKVQITVKNDKIRVQTDSDISYAIPAECDVDIVLAVPTNGAACNVNNADKRSTTAGSSYTNGSTFPTEDAKKTPIYQIGQAYKKFLKDNFEFTRGVNVGIIPCSGNLSMPLDREAWTELPSQFVESYFLLNQNDYPPYLRGAFLYGTLALETLSTYWKHFGNNVSSLTNTMCRKGLLKTESTCGNNTMCYGDLLSTEDPTLPDKTIEIGDKTFSYSHKFQQKPMRNVCLGLANFLTMTFERDLFGWFYANVFHIVELQADVGRICDLLDLFYPVYLPSNNTSNFIFIPVTWANNLFQNWTNDPKISALNTEGAPSDDGGHLSRPSKLNEGRKKVLILIVNKPDWFEQGELTYLGFNNDYSEIPMIETDCIRFDIDYSSTSKILVYSASHDGKTICGPKKILVFSGTGVERVSDYYECVSGNGTLTFPKKYLVKIVVESIDGSGTFQFTNVTGNTVLHTVTGRTEFFVEPVNMTATNNITFNMTNIRLISAEITNRPYQIVNTTCQYLPLRLPEMSRVVDFSQSVNDRPRFSSNFIAYGQRATSHGVAGSYYDSNLGYWISKSSGDSTRPNMSGNNCTFNQNVVGDYYLLIENIGDTAPEGRFFNLRGPATYTYNGNTNKCEMYYLTGLTRRFQVVSDFPNSNYVIFDTEGSPIPKVKFICAGFTWPVNGVLYWGMDGGTEHAYTWQSIVGDVQNVTNVTDPSVACQNVTVSACAKLKEDFGSNVRIYVIKYRKQPNYKHPISGSTIAFDYSYLDSCASGTAAPFLYDVANEEELNDALSAVATDIKTWAGYKPAENVTVARR